VPSSTWLKSESVKTTTSEAARATRARIKIFIIFFFFFFFWQRSACLKTSHCSHPARQELRKTNENLEKDLQTCLVLHRQTKSLLIKVTIYQKNNIIQIIYNINYLSQSPLLFFSHISHITQNFTTAPPEPTKKKRSTPTKQIPQSAAPPAQQTAIANATVTFYSL